MTTSALLSESSGVFARNTPAVQRDARLRIELTQLRQRLSEPDRYHDPGAVRQAVEGLLTEAETLLDTEDAWCRVHAAARREVAFLTRAHLEVRTTELQYELEKKLAGWRLQAARKHLDGDERPIPEPVFVTAALALLYDKATNDYRKLATAGRRLLVLSIVLGVALAALLAVVSVYRPRDADDFLVVTLLGAVGGALSAVRGVGRRLDQRIPEQMAGYFELLAHPLVGAAAGVGAAVLLRAGILTLAGNGHRVVYGAAFLAGFSERWFIGLVENVGAKSG